MNIVFLTRFDPRNINNWSGTLYYMYNKLKERHNIEVVGPEILNQFGFFSKDNNPKDIFIPIDKYIPKLNELLSERINKLNFDLIFFGDLLFVPFLDVDVPVVYLSDMNYNQLRKHYIKTDERQDEFMFRLEKRVLEISSKIIYSSEWIKRKSIEFYNVDPNKIDIVEFGANIPTPVNYTININLDKCRLVFIGKDWERKGGDKSIQTYRKLKKEGFPCSLTIIGSSPPKTLNESIDDFVIIPFIDKNNPKHSEKLNKILAESHFLVLPTRFDAFGIVFCEASAYALPSISADVGGVGQAINEGKNGFLLPENATADDYAEKIKSIFTDKESYLKLRASSRKEYESRLNWDVWGEKVNVILQEAISDFKKNGK
ncbi:Glycosyltransferase involved in cell wall bisynthesis [Porphyromonadaceae bacterium KH3CP3RA]|nr:Glycosyltransferase involved in cell wall bisynthesis [Porphyromonadaceae bacterium KH3CP3RA]